MNNAMKKIGKKKILVIGAGCVGIYLGAKLKSKGHKVFLLGRRKLNKVSKKIRINGVAFELPQKLNTPPRNVFYDFIFITTKLYNLGDALNIINEYNIHSNCIVSIQNGLVDQNIYNGLLNGKKINIISVFEGIQLVDDQIKVSTTGAGWKIEASVEGAIICDLLNDVGIDCSVESDMLGVRIEKTIANCSLNVLSAIEGKQFCELFADNKIKNRIRSIFDECYKIFCNISTINDKEIMWRRLVDAWSSAQHFSSTYQDLVSDRNTEIEFLTGYVISLGKLHNIPTPENLKLYFDFMKLFNSRRI